MEKIEYEMTELFVQSWAPFYWHAYAFDPAGRRIWRGMLIVQAISGKFPIVSLEAWPRRVSVAGMTMSASQRCRNKRALLSWINLYPVYLRRRLRESVLFFTFYARRNVWILCGSEAKTKYSKWATRKGFYVHCSMFTPPLAHSWNECNSMMNQSDSGR